MTVTFRRVSGRMSPTVQPVAVMTNTITSSLVMLGDDLANAGIGSARGLVGGAQEIELAREIGRDRRLGQRVEVVGSPLCTATTADAFASVAMARAWRAASSRFSIEMSSVWA